jgi:hypothetical protein
MHALGKTFSVRGSEGVETTISICDETDEDFGIRMVTNSQWGYMESDERMSRELFDSCIRTGYLTEVVHNKATAFAR